MATQYTSILKLALPVQGELSGTWGDVVNDNITSMVEEAIAGRAVINTWATNSHTLTTANGTTSESRCAMLEFTDTGTALTGAGEVICPTQTKIYIAKNASGQAITVKTAAGTGIAVQDGETKFVFCDGTNVVEAVTSMTTLKVGTGVQVSTILDEDNMASDSATALATQQSIKAYVDSQITAQDLDFAGDSGTGAVDLDSQSLTVAGTANEIETSASGQTLTVGLPSAVIVTTSVTTPTVQVTNINANDGTTAATIADSTGVVTVASAVLTTADVNGGTIDNAAIGSATPSTGAFTTVTATGNITSQGQVITDTINEQTATTGVTVDGVLLKDGGATFTADAVFGDNDKAIFGAGSDLQIYHDGTRSYIEEGGLGGLWISTNGTEIKLKQSGGADEEMLVATPNGSVDLYYNNSLKLATTSTGVDITGTITSDGLTVDNSGTAILITNGDGLTQLGKFVGDATYGFVVEGKANNNLTLKTNANGAGEGIYFTDTSDNKRMFIEGTTGDISFYEDTGTTAKFFWDASAEMLTTSGLTVDEDNATITIKSFQPKLILDDDSAVGAGSDKLIIQSASAQSAGDYEFVINNDQTSSTDQVAIKISGNGDISFYEDTGTTPKFFWDASAESLGIGTSSPYADGLTVSAGASAHLVIRAGTTTGEARLWFGDSDSDNQGRIEYQNTDDSMLFWTASSEAMRINSDGNVGIGENNPIVRLDVRDSIADTTSSKATNSILSIANEDSTATAASMFTMRSNQGDTTRERAILEAGLEGTSGGYLGFWTRPSGAAISEKMRIDADGNVGIGTDNPLTPLHIEGTSPIIILKDSDTVAASMSGRVDFYGSDGRAGYVGMAATTGLALATETTDPVKVLVDSDEKMRITSSGNVGIGTSSPGNLLEVAGASPIVEINSTSGSPELQFSDGGVDEFSIQYDTGANGLKFVEGGVGAHVTILDGGNVGIGTSSPSGSLHVARSGGADAMLVLENTLGTAPFQVGQGNDNSLRFYDDGTERMRIDSSGNLLVGTTDSQLNNESTNTGVVIRADNQLQIARSEGVTAYFNRLTSDGDIVQFRKDGATVGSIGTTGGNLIVQGNPLTGKTGIKFGGAEWIPQDTGADSDGGVDLGGSSYRFKDLYLSGGVYLGGTTSANLLDDYEEGTWTPVPADAASGGNTGTTSSALGNYTKVGNLVFVTGVLVNINTSGMTAGNDLYVQGLPFSTKDIFGATAYYLGGGVITSAVSSSSLVSPYILDSGSSALNFFDTGGNILVSDVTSGVGDFYFSLTYKAA